MLFIKYGSEVNLKKLRDNGEMFFQPCKYFRDLEEEQKKKGMGDGNDGGITFTNLHIYLECVLTTPTYCLRRTDNEYISSQYRDKFRDQFSEHTHTLIIRDEDSFLENVRFNFRNRAFAHDIFYQDKRMAWDYAKFFFSGDSRIRFYPQSGSKTYGRGEYIECTTGKTIPIVINKAHYHKTMYWKDAFFSN